MPSFIVHTIAGNELLKKLKLNSKEKKIFTIANLLPDSVNMVEINPNWNEQEIRVNIQNAKITTHFRTKEDVVFEYPIVEDFISKYENSIKKDLTTFAYLFHLYTDYYYFKEFLPSLLTFLDENNKEAYCRSKTKYIKLNKSNIIMERQDFFSKTNESGLYNEYNRINKKLITNYKLENNYNYLIDFINKNPIDIKVEEINNKAPLEVIEKLNRLLNDSFETQDENYRIFTLELFDEFIKNIVDTFTTKYEKYINNYK